MGKRGPDKGKGGAPSKKSIAAKAPGQRRIAFERKEPTREAPKPTQIEQPNATDASEANEVSTTTINRNSTGSSFEGQEGIQMPPTATRATATTAVDANTPESGPENGDEPKQYWPEATLNWLRTVKDRFDAEISLDQHARTANRVPKVIGKFPSWALSKIKGQADPYGHNRWRGAADKHGQMQVLSPEDFCYPDLLIWAPELQFPEFYPSGRTKCKFHDSYDCVEYKGWTTEPRHGYDMDGITAIWGRKCRCTVRHAANEKPFWFRGYDNEVVAKAPHYVQSVWRAEGFMITHRGAIRWKLVDSLRSALARGMGASGFHKSLAEAYKRRHFESARKWRNYCDMRYPKPLLNSRLARKEPFVEFHSKIYDGRIPSLAFLIRCVTEDIESRIPYYTRRLQMVDGTCFAGDHSHKITKVILVEGDRAYGAMYSLMNPYGQVMGWWFTNGTSLEEIKPYIQKLMHRYDLHGFEGPHFVFTDRCCGERPFWKENLRIHELIDSAEDFLDEYDHDIVKEVSLPVAPVSTKSTEIVNASVGIISQYLSTLPKERRAIGVDCEWKVGAKKAHVLTIALQDERTFVFQIANLSRFPPALKKLLEEESIIKVGNRIHNDVAKLKAWKVRLHPTAELGHLAKARSISPTKNPSLGFLVNALFGCNLPKDGTPRISQWDNRRGLTEEQIEYAAKDSYASIKVYEKLMTIKKPRRDGRLRDSELTDGVQVTLYNAGWKSRASNACVLNGEIMNDLVLVNIVEDDIVYNPSSMVPSVPSIESSSRIQNNEEDRGDDGGDPNDASSVRQRKTIGELMSVAKAVARDNGDDQAKIVIPWPRNLIGKAPVNDNVSISFKETIVERQDDGDEDMDFEWEIPPPRASADQPAFADGNDDLSTGSADVRREIPRMNKKRRHYHLRKERIKNDILHIFLRFERVLSKEHGAFALFMQALRDALYISNPEDLEYVRQCLREHGFSDTKIDKKLKYEFDWCLQRIRRHVPSPKELERRYQDVIDTYIDVIDARTGKPFFSDKAKAVHKATLKHIRRNCLSDIPGVSYYIEVGTDKYGIPLLKCVRGTSALEGLHQKLRQLVRGFSNSPRFARAIVFEFIFRWNHDLDIAARNLPKCYEHFYDGSALENEIRIMNAWNSEGLKVHTDWLCISEFNLTREVFGVPLPLDDNLTAGLANYEPGGELDQILENDAINAADACLQNEAGDDGNDQVAEALCQAVEKSNEPRHLPASSAWLCSYSKRKRPVKQVQGKEEWEYFESEYMQFQDSTVGATADNYSFINWSAFSDAWNQRLDEEDRRGETSSLTYKNAAILKEAWKQYRRRTNQATTMLGHDEAARNLQKRLRDTTTPFVHAIEFPAAQVPAFVTAPVVPQDTGAENLADFPVTDEAMDPSELPPPKKKRKRKKKDKGAPRAHHRCRKCGHPFAISPWKELHAPPDPLPGNDRKNNLNYQPGRKPYELCSVAEKDRVLGFPIYEGKLPRIR